MMLVFLAIAFLFLTYSLLEVRVQVTTPKIITFLWISGLVLLDLSILAMIFAVWLVEHGKI